MTVKRESCVTTELVPIHRTIHRHIPLAEANSVTCMNGVRLFLPSYGASSLKAQAQEMNCLIKSTC